MLVQVNEPFILTGSKQYCYIIASCHKKQNRVLAFCICFQEEDSNFPSFMKISSSSNSISKMKAPSSTSISNVGVSAAPSRTRESVVTLNYSGARSSSELTLIESNVPKKRKLSIFVFFLPVKLPSCSTFFKGQAPGKLTSCEDDCGGLV